MTKEEFNQKFKTAYQKATESITAESLKQQLTNNSDEKPSHEELIANATLLAFTMSTKLMKSVFESILEFDD